MIADERQHKPTIFALDEEVEKSLWKYLYKISGRIPFVNSVYGNAVFQNNKEDGEYYIYITHTGFSAREIIR